MMKKYTLGFIFTPDFLSVLLIHKVNPPWQQGKINGIGGKTEEGESSRACIKREVREETALNILKNSFELVGRINENGGQIDVFSTVYKGEKVDAKRNDKEDVEWCEVNNLPQNVISNLRWLIPLAIDKLNNKTPKKFLADI